MTRDNSILEETNVELRLSEEELETKRKNITSFIEEMVEKAGADGVVLGLSGGIDSTTTGYLAAEAVGADNLHGLIMPGKVNTDENMTDAEYIANELDIEYDVIEIEPIFEAFTGAYPAGADDKMAAGNVRVRIRGVLNYFVANHEDCIVLGTGNRSEAMTGYFTKYGDQAVDCNPIGNLYKCQVRQLARHLGVPENVVTKPPSAEMWIGQTDEGELGLDYDTLDAILALYIDGPLSKSATARSLNVEQTLIERVEELVDKSRHKRQMPPAP